MKCICDSNMYLLIGDEFVEIYECESEICDKIAIRNVEICEEIQFYQEIKEEKDVKTKKCEDCIRYNDCKSKLEADQCDYYKEF